MGTTACAQTLFRKRVKYRPFGQWGTWTLHSLVRSPAHCAGKNPNELIRFNLAFWNRVIELHYKLSVSINVLAVLTNEYYCCARRGHFGTTIPLK